MELTVKPLRQKDAGRRLAAIDRKVMDALGWENGDYVAVEGDARAVCRVWPGYAEDEGERVVRIDGTLRREVGVGINGTVTVERANVEPAERIVLLLPENFRVKGDLEPVLQDQIGGQAFEAGDSVQFNYGMGAGGTEGFRSGPRIDDAIVPLEITETEPAGPVVVTDETTIDLTTRHEVADDDSAADNDEDAEGTEHDAHDDGSESVASGADESWVQELAARPVVGLLLVVGIVTVVLASAFLLDRATDASFAIWVRNVGTVVLVCFGALQLWHSLSR